MIMYLIAGSTAAKLIMNLGPVKRLMDSSNKNLLLKGSDVSTTCLPVIDNVLEKHIGVNLTRMQKVSHRKFLVMTRKIVNTRVFELVTAKMLHDKWPGDSTVNSTVKLR